MLTETVGLRICAPLGAQYWPGHIAPLKGRGMIWVSVLYKHFAPPERARAAESVAMALPLRCAPSLRLWRSALLLILVYDREVASAVRRSMFIETIAL